QHAQSVESQGVHPLDRIVDKRSLQKLRGDETGARSERRRRAPRNHAWSSRSGWRRWLTHLRLQVILQADFSDQLELRFEPVNVLLFGFEYRLEKFARYIVTDAFAMGDRGFKQRVSGVLEIEVA